MTATGHEQLEALSIGMDVQNDLFRLADRLVIIDQAGARAQWAWRRRLSGRMQVVSGSRFNTGRHVVQDAFKWSVLLLTRAPSASFQQYGSVGRMRLSVGLVLARIEGDSISTLSPFVVEETPLLNPAVK